MTTPLICASCSCTRRFAVTPPGHILVTVKCETCGALFDTLMPPLPLLRGLTLDQCEALRGYCETWAAVGAAVRDASRDTFGAADHESMQNSAKRTIEALDDVPDPADQGAHAEGVRFALAVPFVAEAVTLIRKVAASR